MHVEIAPDAFEQIMAMPMREALVADRLMEKMWHGSFERFAERATHTDKLDGAWKIRRQSVEFRVIIDPVSEDAVLATVIGAKVR
jgi:predicted HD phosphohydrolase